MTLVLCIDINTLQDLQDEELGKVFPAGTMVKVSGLLLLLAAAVSGREIQDRQWFTSGLTLSLFYFPLSFLNLIIHLPKSCF